MKTGLHPLVWLYLIAVVIPVGFDLGLNIEMFPDRAPEPCRVIHRPLPERGEIRVVDAAGCREPAPLRLGCLVFGHQAKSTPDILI